MYQNRALPTLYLSAIKIGLHVRGDKADVHPSHYTTGVLQCFCRCVVEYCRWRQIAETAEQSLDADW